MVGTSHGDQDGWLCFWDPPKKKKPFLFFGKTKADLFEQIEPSQSMETIPAMPGTQLFFQMPGDGHSRQKSEASSVVPSALQDL